MRASNIKTGMTFHDNSEITVLSETKCFITVSLSNGEGMEGKSVTVKWKKTSDINLKGV
tara:strand:- start:430 stop:606 length:177 start_codon:yes stop_codon:yes gene_type:complete